MRRTTCAVAVALCLGAGSSLSAETRNIVPTTTLSAETGNNTSTANTFVAQANGNLGPGNISKVPIYTLLYSGNNTAVYAHFMPWFGQSSHMDPLATGTAKRTTSAPKTNSLSAAP